MERARVIFPASSAPRGLPVVKRRSCGVLRSSSRTCRTPEALPGLNTSPALCWRLRKKKKPRRGLTPRRSAPSDCPALLGLCARSSLQPGAPLSPSPSEPWTRSVISPCKFAPAQQLFEMVAYICWTHHWACYSLFLANWKQTGGLFISIHILLDFGFGENVYFSDLSCLHTLINCCIWICMSPALPVLQKRHTILKNT